MPRSTEPRIARLAKIIGLSLAATLALAACTGPPFRLAGTDFVSVAVTEAGASRPLVAGTRIQLSFTETDLGGSAGCNHFGGNYRVDAGRLLFESGGMTAMGCDPALEAQELWVFGLLGSKPVISLIGTDLTLTSGSVVITLRDRDVVEPDAQLVGPTWTLDSIIGGDAVSSVPAGLVATLVFRDDGSLDVSTGCNRGSGTWSAAGGGIQVGPLLLTKMPCQKDPATLESAVLAVLDAGPISAEIDGSVLTLVAGNQGLVLRAT